MINYAAMRRAMVDSQIRTNRVSDERVISALREVPRERFVPQRLKGIAYIDEDLEIAAGRYLMEPMVLARLLDTARVRSSDVALDVGSGTGYGATVLARLASTVVAVEADAALAGEAGRALIEAGAENVAVMGGPPLAGFPGQAPYDVILIEGAVEAIPEALLTQLGEDGRLVAVIRRRGEVGQAVLVERHHGLVSRRVLFDASIQPLVEPSREPSFTF
ncbi:MAG: protein-L-isoaspartate O-methyltransferase [Alphaproteobacteria bacterium]|nr:protein-L-isoaspartate O-methyltransferase [Alphaproteobacteria bacterium]